MKSESFIEYPYSETLCIDMNHMIIANVSGLVTKLPLICSYAS